MQEHRCSIDWGLLCGKKPLIKGIPTHHDGCRKLQIARPSRACFGEMSAEEVHIEEHLIKSHVISLSFVRDFVERLKKLVRALDELLIVSREVIPAILLGHEFIDGRSCLEPS